MAVRHSRSGHSGKSQNDVCRTPMPTRYAEQVCRTPMPNSWTQRPLLVRNLHQRGMPNGYAEQVCRTPCRRRCAEVCRIGSTLALPIETTFGESTCAMMSGFAWLSACKYTGQWKDPASPTWSIGPRMPSKGYAEQVCRTGATKGMPNRVCRTGMPNRYAEHLCRKVLAEPVARYQH